MNGFLSNLSARSFDFVGETALVHPRLPSLFEPLHKKWGDLLEVPAGWEPGEKTGSTGLERTRWEDSPERAQPLQDRRWEKIPHGLSIRLRKDAGSISPNPAGKDAATGDEGTAGGNSGYGTRVQHESRGMTQQLKGPETTVCPTLVAGADGQSEVGEAEIGERSNRLAVTTLKARGEGWESLVHASGKPAFRPAEPAAPPAGEERRFRTAAPKPEPTIQVTIGRIEVRATVPPQRHPPKPVTQPPVMGLEEYLGRRSRGRDL